MSFNNQSDRQSNRNIKQPSNIPANISIKGSGSKRTIKSVVILDPDKFKQANFHEKIAKAMKLNVSSKSQRNVQQKLSHLSEKREKQRTLQQQSYESNDKILEINITNLESREKHKSILEKIDNLKLFNNPLPSSKAKIINLEKGNSLKSIPKSQTSTLTIFQNFPSSTSNDQSTHIIESTSTDLKSSSNEYFITNINDDSHSEEINNSKSISAKRSELQSSDSLVITKDKQLQSSKNTKTQLNLNNDLEEDDLSNAIEFVDYKYNRKIDSVTLDENIKLEISRNKKMNEKNSAETNRFNATSSNSESSLTYVDQNVVSETNSFNKKCATNVFSQMDKNIIDIKIIPENNLIPIEVGTAIEVVDNQNVEHFMENEKKSKSKNQDNDQISKFASCSEDAAIESTIKDLKESVPSVHCSPPVTDNNNKGRKFKRKKEQPIAVIKSARAKNKMGRQKNQPNLNTKNSDKLELDSDNNPNVAPVPNIIKKDEILKEMKENDVRNESHIDKCFVQNPDSPGSLPSFSSSFNLVRNTNIDQMEDNNNAVENRNIVENLCSEKIDQSENDLLIANKKTNKFEQILNIFDAAKKSSNIKIIIESSKGHRSVEIVQKNITKKDQTYPEIKSVNYEKRSFSETTEINNSAESISVIPKESVIVDVDNEIKDKAAVVGSPFVNNSELISKSTNALTQEIVHSITDSGKDASKTTDEYKQDQEKIAVILEKNDGTKKPSSMEETLTAEIGAITDENKQKYTLNLTVQNSNADFVQTQHISSKEVFEINKAKTNIQIPLHTLKLKASEFSKDDNDFFGFSIDEIDIENKLLQRYSTIIEPIESISVNESVNNDSEQCNQSLQHDNNLLQSTSTQGEIKKRSLSPEKIIKTCKVEAANLENINSDCNDNTEIIEKSQCLNVEFYETINEADLPLNSSSIVSNTETTIAESIIPVDIVTSKKHKVYKPTLKHRKTKVKDKNSKKYVNISSSSSLSHSDIFENPILSSTPQKPSTTISLDNISDSAEKIKENLSNDNKRCNVSEAADNSITTDVSKTAEYEIPKKTNDVSELVSSVLNTTLTEEQRQLLTVLMPHLNTLSLAEALKSKSENISEVTSVKVDSSHLPSNKNESETLCIDRSIIPETNETVNLSENLSNLDDSCFGTIYSADSCSNNSNPVSFSTVPPMEDVSKSDDTVRNDNAMAIEDTLKEENTNCLKDRNTCKRKADIEVINRTPVKFFKEVSDEGNNDFIQSCADPVQQEQILACTSTIVELGKPNQKEIVGSEHKKSNKKQIVKRISKKSSKVDSKSKTEDLENILKTGKHREITAQTKRTLKAAKEKSRKTNKSKLVRNTIETDHNTIIDPFIVNSITNLDLQKGVVTVENVVESTEAVDSSFENQVIVNAAETTALVARLAKKETSNREYKEADDVASTIDTNTHKIQQPLAPVESINQSLEQTGLETQPMDSILEPVEIVEQPIEELDPNQNWFSPLDKNVMSIVNDVKLHPRMLLVNKIEELDKPLPEPGPLESKEVRCGACKEAVRVKLWQSHMIHHYGIAWIDGMDKPIDLESRREILCKMIGFAKLHKIQSYKCKLCNDVKKSALGFLGHCESCVTPNRASQKYTCVLCKSQVVRKAIPYHIKTCSMVNVNKRKNVTCAPLEPVSTGRIKRQTVIKAETKFKEVQAVNEADYVRKFKRNLHGGSIKFRHDMTKHGFSTCRAFNCTFKTTELIEMTTHERTCPLMIRKGYQCTICKYVQIDENDVLTHVRKNHDLKPVDPSSEGGSDFDANSDVEIVDMSSVDDDEVELGDDTRGKSGRKRKRRYILKNFDACMWRIVLRHDLDRETQYDDHDFARYIQWTKHFRNINYANKTLFQGCLPQLIHLSVNEYNEYKPRNGRSMKFHHNKAQTYNKYIGENKAVKSWNELERLQSAIVNDEHFIFAGGSINNVKWAPLPDDYPEDGPQYLVVTCQKNLFKYTKVDNPKERKSIIFVWAISDISKSTNSEPAELAYAIKFDSGPIHDLVFLPSGGYDPSINRLGVVAIASIRPEVKIIALPLKATQDCDNSSNLSKFLDIRSTISLKLNIYEKHDIANSYFNSQCTKLVWSEANGHKFIVGGFSNGFIALWNLDEEQNLNRFEKDGMQNYVPTAFFRSSNAVITGLDMHYDTDGLRWIVVTSNNRECLFYDLRDINMLSILSDTEMLRCRPVCVSWPIYWQCCAYGLSADYIVTGHTNAYVKCPSNFCYKTKPFAGASSGFTDICFDPWENTFLTGTINGDVIVRTMRHIMTDIPSKPSLRRRHLLYADIVSLDGQNIPTKNKESSVVSKNIKTESEEFIIFDFDYKKKYGIIFSDYISTHIHSTDGSNSTKRNPPFKLTHISCVCCLACNTNWTKSKDRYVAIAYGNGLVRIINIRKLFY